MQDRFVEFMLILVAVLLAANLFQSNGTQSAVQLPAIIGSVQAQNQSQRTGTVSEADIRYKVSRLEGYSVEDLQEVVSVGDGRSFVVSNPKGFMVYQVVPSR